MARPAKEKVTKKSLQAPKKSIMTKKIVSRKSVAAEPKKTGEAAPRRRHTKQGRVAEREIKLLQKSVKNCLPKAAFGRLVRDITSKFGL